MSNKTTTYMPNLISKLLSGGALWRADSRHAPVPSRKRVDSWLSLGFARMQGIRVR
jgi:hypothetical protein